jgi:uncharacterized protein YegJ (DUF2314 family)
MRNIMKLIKLLILLPFCFGCVHNQTKKNASANRLGLDTTAHTYSVMAEDLAMNSAIIESNKTLGEFDKALRSNDPSYTAFSVKTRYKTPDGGGEHMWIAGIKLVNGNYRGFVNNEAEKTTEVEYGDTVIVHRNEITDWMFLDNNVLRGGYTIRVIRDRLSKEERIKMDEELGFKIDD